MSCNNTSFTKILVGLAIVSAIQGCNWEDKYAVVDCSAKADPGIVDCRSDGTVIDDGGGGTGFEDNNGNMVSFERDTSQLQLLTETDSTTWSESHEDQIDLLVSASADQIFVGSKFHNYLHSFQSDALGKLTPLDANVFLHVSGDRYEVDAVTGASEQVFNQLSINTVGAETLLVAQAGKYKGSSASTGVGVYIEPLLTLGAVPALSFASGDSHNFISYSSVRASTSRPDGTQIAVTGDDRMVKTYNTGNFTTAAVSARLGIRGSSITYSADAESLYVGGLALVPAVVALDSKDLSERWTIDVADKPVALLPESSGGVVAVLASGSSAYWLPKDGDKEKIVTIPLATQASAAAIGSDGTILATGDTDRGVEVISLKTGQRARITHSDAVQAVAIDGFGNLWVVSQRSLKGYQLPDGFE
ncbi:MAG: hypothetical protein CSA52_01540 [Gammaproteobacteria bacterium]|nr:MAG: hypothetical protein CSB48_09430 [Pseudomonadota bacterium]PIE38654.1 MAG: hypothetical protein CSA52_01540 [Gammaproteobacteria bacterium]